MTGSRPGGCLGPCVYPAVPDGGWGWAIAAAFFLVEVCTYGVIKSLGIFLEDLIKDFGESNTRVSWVLSICVFVMTFTAPLSTVLSNRFGFRPVVMTGGFLISLGTVTSAFVSSIDQMYLTLGLVSGLGYCLAFLPTVTILAQYFHRRRATVTSVASSGESFAMCAFGPALTALKGQIGWRYCLILIGLLQASVIGCGSLLRPIVIEPQHKDPPPIPENEQQQQLQQPSPSLKRLQITYDLENEQTRTSISSGDSRGSNDSGVTSLTASSTDVGAAPAAPTETKALMMEWELEQGSASVPPAPLKMEWEEQGSASVPPAPLKMEWEEQGSASVPPAPLKMEWEEQGSPLKRLDGGVEVALGDARRPSSRAKLLDFSVLEDPAFICYSLFGLFATLGFFAPPLYVVELSKSRGVEESTAAYMLSIMAVADVCGRLSIGATMNRLPCRKTLVMLGCVVLLCLVLVAFTVVWEFWGLAVCSALYGFFMGSVGSTHIPLLAEEDVVGVRKMASSVGVYVCIQSFAGLAGPPLGGVLIDATENYGSAFYSCAVGMGLGAACLALVGPARAATRRRAAGTQGPCPSSCSPDNTSSQGDEQPDFLEVDLAPDSVSPVKRAGSCRDTAGALL